MLDIGIFAPHGTDHDQNIAFCQDSDVHHIILPANALAPRDGDGVPDPDLLKDIAQNYARGGVTLAGLTPPRLNLETLPNEAVRTAEIDVITRIIEGMGEAQIPYLHFYLNNKDTYPTDPEDQEQHWKLLVDVYRKLTSTAERCDVKVSTHHYHAPGRPLWNFETMSQLFDEVDSPANGVIFCQGKSELAGDPLAETVLKFQDKVFMVHIRDIVTHISDSAEKELHDRLAAIGYLEVGFGTGECDMPGTIRSLKQIGYTGQLYPEHFPTIAGDRAAGLAWCIGYIRALDQMIEP